MSFLNALIKNIQRILPTRHVQSNILSFGSKHAGVRITHENAQQISAVFRAVSYISESIMSLPWHLHRIQPYGSTRIIDNQINFILHRQANPEQSATTWRQDLLSYALRWGHGYSEIVRNNRGEIEALGEPIHPENVMPYRDEQTNKLWYRVISDKSGIVHLQDEDMFHLRGRLGLSVIQYAARSLSIASAQEENVASFFGNGNQASAVLTHPNVLSKTAHENLTKSIEERLEGPKNAHKFLVIEEGMTWKQTSIPNEDAQMMESREFSVQEIARWFGLPPHILMDYGRATWGNLEQASTEAVRSGLMPWIVRLESEANTKLLQGPNRLSRSTETKINLKGLLRADTQTRNEAYAKGRQWGWLSANDVRGMEDMPPIEGGDIYLNPMNMTPASNDQPTDPDDQQSQIRAPDAPLNLRDSLKIMLADVCNRIVSRETNQITQYSLREDFNAWFDKWLPKHAEYTRAALEPIMVAYTMADTGTPTPDVSVNELVTDYIDNLRDSIRIASDNGGLTEYCNNSEVFRAALADEWFMMIRKVR